MGALKHKTTKHVGPLQLATYYHGVATLASPPMLTSYASLKHKKTQHFGPLKLATHCHGFATFGHPPMLTSYTSQKLTT